MLSCIDSRASVELILDLGIGDTFNSRIAGNIVNEDILGSMEYACAVAGSKVVLVMGHTACGASKAQLTRSNSATSPACWTRFARRSSQPSMTGTALRRITPLSMLLRARTWN